MDVATLVRRLTELGAEVAPVGDTPWVPLIEARLGRRLPPLFRALVTNYTFGPTIVGDVEMFSNRGDDSWDDLTAAPFSDPHMAPWLIERGLLQFGRPSSGAYDPVCFDTAGSGLAEEPRIVRLSHEKILLEQAEVPLSEIAPSLPALVGMP
jgi:hypothetical protein